MTPTKQRWLVALSRFELLLARKEFDLLEDAWEDYLRKSVEYGREVVTNV